MFIDLNEIDLIKGITRAEAKGVHKDLPPGGAWKTIKGHHVYIKDGKVLAGSIPGVTKAKKMTKATMAEHQAALDAEGKKKNGNKKSQGSSGKAKKNTGKAAGTGAKGKSGAKKTKDSGSGKAAGKGVASKEKANGTTKLGAKTDGKTKQSSKPATKSSRTGKPVSAGGAKKGASEGPKSNTSTKKRSGVKPKANPLQALAASSTDGMDMWANAHENMDHLKALKEEIKNTEGSGITDKLNKIHAKYGVGSGVSEYKPMNPKAMDDFEAGTASVKPQDIKLTLKDDHHSEASAPSGSEVIFRSDMLKQPMDLQRHVMTHEIGHVLSNAYPGLASHVWDNPQDALGRTNQKKGRFEGVSITPEESWAEAFAQYHTDPEHLKKRNPKAYEFVKTVLPKISNYKKYLDAGLNALDKANGKGKSTSDDHLEVFHGTALPKLDTILAEGFKPNGGHADFGWAAYFKSPAFDPIDKKEHQDWVEQRKAKGQPVPSQYETGKQQHGNDTTNIVDFFKDRKQPAVIKALVPKEHVLDCTNGRPKELQKLLKEADEAEGSGEFEPYMAMALKHLAGVDTEGMSNAKIRSTFDKHKPEMNKVWGRDVNYRRISPYELYAKKTGIKAIVDRLDTFKEEGWQIGVYDPSIIQIKDHGKGLERTPKGVELLKALQKAGILPYCLLHHHIDDEGLHLHIGVQGGSMEKSFYIDLSKAITRTEAKAVHKELPPGGQWRTIKGHHIYIKDGKVLAGSIPGATKAKKATKAQLAEHQETIDAENKPKKGAKKDGKSAGKATKNTKKVPEKPKKTTTGKKRSDAVKPAPAKPDAAPKPKKQAGKKTAPKAAPKEAKKEVAPKKAPAKKPKDIRTDAQKNRELAYDVGDKVGGARKDEFIASFKEKPTEKSLAELEKMSGAIAEKMVTKANLLPKLDFEQEHANGVDLPTALLKKIIQDRIAPKPDPSTPESRKAYMVAMNKVHRHFAGIKSFENMRDALREMSNLARKAEQGKAAEYNLAKYQANPERWSYFNSEIHAQRIADGKEASKFMDFNALGEKFNNLLTNYESLNRSIDTVRKNTKEGWDKYLTPQAKKAPKKKGEENKRWEREAVEEHLRKGGKETKVKKPEDLMKEFHLRGVEFGHWVNDSSGLFHLKRCAEAFDDLAETIGVDKNDISLNGRLAIAFGARGKGTALAHYEPDRKVINMTKHGGAGSLAHEWGHAMDNILYQYSNGGQESLGLASQVQMGDSDPKLKSLYDNLIDAITKPAPGEKGGSVQMLLDSEAKQLTRYYPEMRRQIGSGMKPEDVYHHWANKINEQYDRYVQSAKNSPYNPSPEAKAKAVKKYEQKRSRELKDIGHYLAAELRLKQNGGKYGGEHYKGHIEIPTGKSEYATRMEQEDGGKKDYWGSNEEMFARVFESWVQDKMTKAKRSNNYLVHGTSEGAAKSMGAPFPIGKERTHMFKAMENLMKYVSSKGTLKKALMLEILASGKGDMTEELRKSLGYTKRSAYNVANPDDCIYIPTNRLRTVYQTEEATNWDKVEENRKRMESGENLEPVSIGFDYDVHDGHHRIEAAKALGHEHIPCIVKGGNDLERERAVEAYREIWKSIQEDPTNPYDKEPNVMFRGVGAKELRNINKTMFIQSKGKGNDADKGISTCFSNLYSQAEGYARSNYELYNEKHAFVLVVRKPEDIEEDEHGELVAHRPIPVEDVLECVYIPKPR